MFGGGEDSQTYQIPHIKHVLALDFFTVPSAAGLDHTKFILKTLEEIDSGMWNVILHP